MTKLAMRGMRSTTGTYRTEEDRRFYRRWARAMCFIDFIVFAVLLIGVSLYDRQTLRMARSNLTAGIEMRTMPASSQNASGVRK